VLKAHLVSRLGQRFGNNCVGADLASDVTVSGKIRGNGHQLMLDEIRIDRVDDEAVRNALNLALQSTRIPFLELRASTSWNRCASRPSPPAALRCMSMRCISRASRRETTRSSFNLT